MMRAALLLLFVAAALGLGLAGARRGDAAGAGPMPVTSDTATYCRSLAARVAVARPSGTAVTAADALAAAGRRLCRHGDVLGGILRLRRALLIELHPRAR